VFPVARGFLGNESDRYAEMASDATTKIAARPPLAGPRVLLTGAPVDGHTYTQAIESLRAWSLTKSARGEAAPRETTCGWTTTPWPRSPTKYRSDSIGARTPVDSLRRLTETMLDEVDAVVVSLPPDDAVFGWDYPGLRDLLQARGIPHVCLRGDPHEEPTPADHAALGELVSAASRLQEARHG
jgi:hypothetical protein